MSLKVSISGIRGIYPDDLPEQLIINYVNAYCSIQNTGDIIIGYDGRIHGLEIMETVCETVLRNDRNVTNIGLIPTPSIQFLTNKYQFAGAIMITASHNPIEWNGLKFMDEDGCFISSQKYNILIEKYNKLLSNQSSSSKKFLRGKEKHRLYSAEEHIDDTLLIPLISQCKISDMNYSTSIDTINGGGSKAIPMLLEKLNCNVTSINNSPGTPYPRDPEPRPENLNDLSELVLKNKSDIGFASDPDADRVCLVSEKGHSINEELSLAICTEFYCQYSKDNKGITTNLSTSHIIDSIAKKYNKKVLRSAVGEANVVNLMKTNGIAFGGEGNGGIIYGPSHYGRDSIVGIGMILGFLSMNNHSISTIVSNFPNYYMIKEKILTNDYNSLKLKNFIDEKYPNAYTDTTDGIKIIFDKNSSWVHIRSSNTEPVVRIIAESSSSQITKELVSTFKSAL